ncbi:DUF4864 domain-containing protein [bacterium]|nr:DUF4864 domain-containing protein [bacterium]
MKWRLIIKKVWIIALFISLLSTLVFADESAMVRNTISSQIEAFKENNIEKAYTFAAPNIQAQFSKPEVFGLMVKNGYPTIWRPKSFKFTKFQNLGNKSIQRVLFQSFDGSLETYDYILEKYGDLWKIAGVLTINLAGET